VAAWVERLVLAILHRHHCHLLARGAKALHVQLRLYRKGRVHDPPHPTAKIISDDGQQAATRARQLPGTGRDGDLQFTGLDCAYHQGFSLHAAVRCEADERQRLEQLCRYITRPAPANERVQCISAGQVVIRLKTPWREDTTHLVMSPPEFMQRLAALVRRPRLHLIRLHGSELWLRTQDHCGYEPDSDNAGWWRPDDHHLKRTTSPT